VRPILLYTPSAAVAPAQKDDDDDEIEVVWGLTTGDEEVLEGNLS
jgi:hypothetical protein